MCLEITRTKAKTKKTIDTSVMTCKISRNNAFSVQSIQSVFYFSFNHNSSIKTNAEITRFFTALLSLFTFCFPEFFPSFVRIYSGHEFGECINHIVVNIHNGRIFVSNFP